AADRFTDGRRGLHQLFHCAEWTTLRHAESCEGCGRRDNQLRRVHECRPRFSDCGVRHISPGPSGQSHEEGDSSTTSIGEGVSAMPDVDACESDEMRALRLAADSRMIRQTRRTEPLMIVKRSLLALFFVLFAA